MYVTINTFVERKPTTVSLSIIVLVHLLPLAVKLIILLVTTAKYFIS